MRKWPIIISPHYKRPQTRNKNRLSNFVRKNMKKIVSIFLAVLILVFCLSSCGAKESEYIDIEKLFGFVKIQNESNLYYDIDTHIVYFIASAHYFGYKVYGFMSPYYAPNGLPYAYDIIDYTLVEIDE